MRALPPVVQPRHALASGGASQRRRRMLSLPMPPRLPPRRPPMLLAVTITVGGYFWCRRAVDAAEDRGVEGEAGELGRGFDSRGWYARCGPLQKRADVLRFQRVGMRDEEHRLLGVRIAHGSRRVQKGVRCSAVESGRVVKIHARFPDALRLGGVPRRVDGFHRLPRGGTRARSPNCECSHGNLGPICRPR